MNSGQIYMIEAMSISNKKPHISHDAVRDGT